MIYKAIINKGWKIINIIMVLTFSSYIKMEAGSTEDNKLIIYGKTVELNKEFNLKKMNSASLAFLSKYDERFFLAEDIKIKSEVEFYIITIPPQMYLIVKYNNEAFWIDPFSIGYFVESISSPSQAKNMLLDCMSVSGKSINQDAYNQIIHEIVKSGKKDWIINENPQAYGATCSTIPEHKELFIVKLLMLNNSEITEKHFIVDSGGHVTNIVNNICIKGPLSIAGAVPMDKDLPLFNSIISSAMEKEKHDLKGGKTTAPNAEDNDILILK